MTRRNVVLRSGLLSLAVGLAGCEPANVVDRCLGSMIRIDAAHKIHGYGSFQFKHATVMHDRIRDDCAAQDSVIDLYNTVVGGR